MLELPLALASGSILQLKPVAIQWGNSPFYDHTELTFYHRQEKTRLLIRMLNQYLPLDTENTQQLESLFLKAAAITLIYGNRTNYK